MPATCGKAIEMNGGGALTTEQMPAKDGKALNCRIFRDGRPAAAPASFSDLSEILKEARSFVWFDMIDPATQDLAVLEKEFALHLLAIEDAVQAHQRPKIEEYTDYWFIIVKGVSIAAAGTIFHEVAIFAGTRFVVTVRHSPAYPLDEIERRWLNHPEPLRHDSGHLVYTILDTIVDGYFPVTEELQERIDALEVSLFERRPRHDALLRQIFNMKKDVQQFRRTALPMREILNPIIRRDLTLFTETETAYFRDVYDHAVRVMDQLDAMRDLVNSALEMHLSVIANRQNAISKQLAVIATIFLPMSFITGFFGQNFAFLVNRITDVRAFWIFGVGSQITALIILLLYFWRKGWL